MAHAPARWLAAAALLAAPAHAIELGAVEVGSALGEPLDARIPLRVAPGERFEAACFYLAHAGLGEGPRLTLALERSARGAALRLRSAAPFNLPVATIGVGVSCPGREPQAPREMALLVDPRSRVRPPIVASAPPVAASITARDDASLASLARTIHPSDPQARAAYLEALEAANPDLAARGAQQPIAAGTAIALPDLRTFHSTRRAAARGIVPEVVEAAPAQRRVAAPDRPLPAEVEPPPAPVPRRAAPPAPAPRVATLPAPASPPRPPDAIAPKTEEPRTSPRPTQPQPATAPRAPSSADATAAAGGFVLRLSGAEVDLSRSRGIDDRRRAQLRERQLILDQDDQVSALLSMKHSLKQLEARVSELQLKLAGMPASFPERPAAVARPAQPQEPKAGSVEPAKPAPPPPTAVPGLPDGPKSTQPPAVAANATSVAPAPASAPASVAPAPASAPASVAPVPAQPAGAAVPMAKPPAKAAASAPAAAWNPTRLLREHGAWIAGAAAALLFILASVSWRRHRRGMAEAEAEDQAPQEIAHPTPAGEVGEIAAPVVAAPVVERATISSDEHLPTRLRDPDAGDLRRRYIEERFPEVASRAIRLEDTDSVLKGARLFYEDGELPRAIELLQLAIEGRPVEVRLWLALFEVFRLERLSGEFAQLAARFRELHGQTEHWRKVQYFGREVDPGHALYREEPVSTLETIGPREARRLAAARADFDPIAENWLNAPMDFENEVLSNDLRRSLMAEAGIAEQDLLPAPRSALRNVEMFTVA